MPETAGISYPFEIEDTRLQLRSVGVIAGNLFWDSPERIDLFDGFDLSKLESFEMEANSDPTLVDKMVKETRKLHKLNVPSTCLRKMGGC